MSPLDLLTSPGGAPGGGATISPSTSSAATAALNTQASSYDLRSGVSGVFTVGGSGISFGTVAVIAGAIVIMAWLK